MKNKTIKNIMKIVSITLVIFSMFMIKTSTIGGVQAKQLTQDEKNQVYKNDTDINNMAADILSYVAYACYAAAFIIVIVKGVKFMKASPEGKAQIKEEMVAVAVGAFILFAIGSFIKIIATFALNNVG